MTLFRNIGLLLNLDFSYGHDYDMQAIKHCLDLGTKGELPGLEY
jgi:hypothetical protein